MSKLYKGDLVIWRNSWGKDDPEIVKVTAIEKTTDKHSKYGVAVDSMLWSDIDFMVVDLETGNWAYGFQLKPLPQRISSKFYSWFSSCCLCTVEHPKFGKHQVTPYQYLHSSSEYKKKLKQNIIDMFLKGELDMEKYNKHSN